MNGTAPGGALVARHQQIPAADSELSGALAWLSLASKRRVSNELTRSIMEHHRRTRCEPAILIAAAVQYLIQGADREPDCLNRYWHLADQVSARTRTRYIGIDESDLL